MNYCKQAKFDCQQEYQHFFKNKILRYFQKFKIFSFLPSSILAITTNLCFWNVADFFLCILDLICSRYKGLVLKKSKSYVLIVIMNIERSISNQNKIIKTNAKCHQILI
jgi:hypothetical protein